MPDIYFSDKEAGPTPKILEEITSEVWGGLLTYVEGLILKGAFGEHFPKECPDGQVPCGTDESRFYAALRAEVPGLPLELRLDEPPSALDTMDFLEFCHEHVSKPIQVKLNSFSGPYHLGFDAQSGRADFRGKVNKILGRNGLAFELDDSGQVRRLASPALRESLPSAVFATGDKQLDVLLESARTKFLDPDPAVRREALEKLWDAWERVKTLEGPNKRKAAEVLLAKASAEPNFREVLETEARALTSIGNSFSIRHSETTQVPLGSTEHVDYLFHRLFSLMWLMLQSR